MIKKLSSGADGRSRIEFFCPCGPECKVMVAGSFNDWEPEEAVMEYDHSRCGHYVVLLLPPGEYEYKFVRNDDWIPDDGNPIFTANDFGTINSVVKVD